MLIYIPYSIKKNETNLQYAYKKLIKIHFSKHTDISHNLKLQSLKQNVPLWPTQYP